MQQRVELIAVTACERGIKGTGEIGGAAVFDPKGPFFSNELWPARHLTGFAAKQRRAARKIPLKPANGDAIIRTVSRIIFNPSRRSPQESRGGAEREMQR